MFVFINASLNIIISTMNQLAKLIMSCSIFYATYLHVSPLFKTGASNSADTLFQEVLGRKDKADSTRNALNVLQRFKFLFNLPLSVERNIQKVFDNLILCTCNFFCPPVYSFVMMDLFCILKRVIMM